MGDYETDAEKTWCKGCGNFGILNAIENTIPKLEQDGIKKENIVISAGIGCHAKIFDYLKLSGLYSLHGRDIATVQGMKIANPNLKVITFSGDGNGMGEGLAHTLFAAKRNTDMTMILHHNDVYALTTGQFTPLTEKGWEGPSTPRGSIERPFNPISLLISAGASFVARSFAGKIDHLTDTVVQAIEHEGFSFVEVLQPAVPYHEWSEYNKNIEFLEKQPETYLDAINIAHNSSKWTLGVFYKVNREVYHRSLYGNLNPIKDSISRDERIKKVEEILTPK
ncbi:MAG: 2-oxoacid:ferredoxin oxidoreductase subunit beta [Candidatus Lokiarchaeota archaeon]|nr:2-oxoacid:ferredoxin oxidoreductase subunit beta [Candidatus Lokiarchaeota archaeon]MBD3341558.1 2-oxoacid:ferredoxin oxidoreductase subunit beta [Candidatus Lokiarchaeota archaeon]